MHQTQTERKYRSENVSETFLRSSDDKQSLTSKRFPSHVDVQPLESPRKAAMTLITESNGELAKKTGYSAYNQNSRTMQNPAAPMICYIVAKTVIPLE